MKKGSNFPKPIHLAILTIIQETPGILQKNLPSHFPDEEKKSIFDKVRSLAEKNYLSRSREEPSKYKCFITDKGKKKLSECAGMELNDKEKLDPNNNNNSNCKKRSLGKSDQWEAIRKIAQKISSDFTPGAHLKAKTTRHLVTFKMLELINFCGIFQSELKIKVSRDCIMSPQSLAHFFTFLAKEGYIKRTKKDIGKDTNSPGYFCEITLIGKDLLNNLTVSPEIFAQKKKLSEKKIILKRVVDSSNTGISKTQILATMCEHDVEKQTAIVKQLRKLETTEFIRSELQESEWIYYPTDKAKEILKEKGDVKDTTTNILVNKVANINEPLKTELDQEQKMMLQVTKHVVPLTKDSETIPAHPFHSEKFTIDNILAPHATAIKVEEDKKKSKENLQISGHLPSTVDSKQIIAEPLGNNPRVEENINHAYGSPLFNREGMTTLCNQGVKESIEAEESLQGIQCPEDSTEKIKTDYMDWEEEIPSSHHKMF